VSVGVASIAHLSIASSREDKADGSSLRWRISFRDRAFRRAKRAPLVAGERDDDELVTAGDGLAYELVGDFGDGVGQPVALVEVVAGHDRLVPRAELRAEVGVALTLNWSGRPESRLSANIFPPTLNTDVCSPNGTSSTAPVKPRQSA